MNLHNWSFEPDVSGLKRILLLLLLGNLLLGSVLKLLDGKY